MCLRYYHGARYYIPWLARWASSDPLQGEMHEWSSYNYGYCNPIIWTDVTGMEPEDVVSIPKPPTEFKADEQDAQGKKQSSTTSDSDIITGTELYTTEGDYLGKIEGDKPLEIHFMDLSKLPDVVKISVNDVASAQEAINKINQLPSEHRDEFTTAIRGASVAFIGKNSVESLKAIVNNSLGIGRELGFYPEISSSREVVFKEFEVPQSEYEKLAQGNTANWNEQRTPIEAILNLYSANGGRLSDLFGIGHTHIEGWNERPLYQMPVKKWDQKTAFDYYAKPTSQKIPRRTLSYY
jgi:hypothetical protein